MHDSTVLARGAGDLNGAGIAGGRVGSVHHFLLGSCVGPGLCGISEGIVSEEIGVGVHLSGVNVQLPPPDMADLLAQVDDLLEAALEDVNAEPMPGAGEAGVVGQAFVEHIAEISVMR